MSIAEELQKIEELYAHGTLTRDEFEQAKTKVLAEAAPPPVPADSQTARQIAELQRQNAVAQLDRDWDTERQQYMLRGRYGSRSVPTESGSIFSGIFVSAMGVLVLVLGSITASHPDSRGTGALLPLLGVAVILVGIISSVSSYSKAGQYRDAEQRYQENRARLLAEPDET